MDMENEYVFGLWKRVNANGTPAADKLMYLSIKLFIPTKIK